MVNPLTVTFHQYFERHDAHVFIEVTVTIDHDYWFIELHTCKMQKIDFKSRSKILEDCFV